MTIGYFGHMGTTMAGDEAAREERASRDPCRKKLEDHVASDVTVDECGMNGCDNPATEWAYSNIQKKRVKCCRKHSVRVMNKEHHPLGYGPEYHANCPHCGTHFGV